MSSLKFPVLFPSNIHIAVYEQSEASYTVSKQYTYCCLWAVWSFLYCFQAIYIFLFMSSLKLPILFPSKLQIVRNEQSEASYTVSKQYTYCCLWAVWSFLYCFQAIYILLFMSSLKLPILFPSKVQIVRNEQFEASCTVFSSRRYTKKYT